MEELCDDYLAEGCGAQKSSTVTIDRSRIERHIKPLLGHMSVRSVTIADVKKFMQDVKNGKTACDVRTGPRGRAIVKGGRGAASKCVALLGAIYEYAIENGRMKENPAHGIDRPKDRKNERYLSLDELSRLGQTLADAHQDGVNPSAIAALRLLALTGCRRGEILALRWSDVDFEHSCLRLPDSKTGQKVVWLGAPALELLSSLPRYEGNEYAFPGDKEEEHFVGLQKVWEGIRERADLPGVRIHDLRHSFAAAGASGGDSLLIIGALLGHKDQKTTQRYAHLADAPVRRAAERISVQIDAAMRQSQTEKIVNLHGRD